MLNRLSVFKEPLFQALDLNDGNGDDVKSRNMTT